MSKTILRVLSVVVLIALSLYFFESNQNEVSPETPELSATQPVETVPATPAVLPEPTQAAVPPKEPEPVPRAERPEPIATPVIVKQALPKPREAELIESPVAVETVPEAVAVIKAPIVAKAPMREVRQPAQEHKEAEAPRAIEEVHPAPKPVPLYTVKEVPPAVQKVVVRDTKEHTPVVQRPEEEIEAIRAKYENYGKDPVVEPVRQQQPEKTEAVSLEQYAGYGLRTREGTSGLGSLEESKMFIALEIASGVNRFNFGLDMVKLESGALAAAQYSIYGTDGAVAIAEASDSEGGMALNFGYRYMNDGFSVSTNIGMTPNAGNDISAAPLWNLEVEKHFDGLSAYGRFVQRPVTDSMLSYVGNRDLYSEAVWGRVVRQGFEAGVGYEDAYGVAWDLAYYPTIDGENIQENSELRSAVTVSRPLAIEGLDGSRAGVSLLYDSYDFNSEHYTYGHGGYFSPQSYLHGAVTFDMSKRFGGGWLVDARGSVGYASYDNDPVEKYPLEGSVEQYASKSETLLALESAAFIGIDLGEHAQFLAGAGYRNRSDTDEYFIRFSIGFYSQKRRTSSADFNSIDAFARR